MVNKLIVGNVLHRPIRTAVSVLAVAIEVVMVILVVGLCHGLVDDKAKREQGVGADIMVQPPGTSVLMNFSASPMPIKIADKLAQLPHVKAVAPVFYIVNAVKSLSVVDGIDLDSFNRVSGGFIYRAGGPFQGPDDMLVDNIYAEANHVKVGQTVNLLNHNFRVAGIVEQGKGSRTYIPLATAQDMMGQKDKASIFYVKCTDPALTEQTVDAIKAMLPGYSVMPIQEYITLMTTSSNLPGLNYFITAMIGIAVGIGFLVIFLSMYTTITERTREIGILKSLGASKGYIVSAILRESGLLTAVGILLGFASSIILRAFFRGIFPTLPIEFSWDWRFYSACLAFIGSFVGAFYPALKAASLDPVDALAYE